MERPRALPAMAFTCIAHGGVCVCLVAHRPALRSSGAVHLSLGSAGRGQVYRLRQDTNTTVSE